MTAQSGLGFSGIVAIQIPDNGPTGEVLTKQSPDDYDYDWDPVAAAGGDVLTLSITASPANIFTLTQSSGTSPLTVDLSQLDDFAVSLAISASPANILTLDQNINPDRTVDLSQLDDFVLSLVISASPGNILTLDQNLNPDRTVDLSQLDQSGFTLQDVYDNATPEPQIIAIAGDPVSFRAGADPGTIFQLQRNDAGQVFLVESLASGYEITLGPVGNRSWLLAEPTTISNPTSVQIVPDGRTKTVTAALTNAAVITWFSTFTSDIPAGGAIGNDSGFGAVFLIGTLELLDAGNLFSTSIVFNQGTRVDVTAARSGPIYTMVNQPVMVNTGATDRSVSQANAVRSQLRIAPTGAGNITLISHEAFFATVILDSSAAAGDAFATTVNYFAAKAPSFLGVGGVVTTLNVLDIVNIPAAGITNLRGINSAMASGMFINHTGIAASLFTGPVAFDGVTTFDATMEVTDTTLFQLGTTSGAEFSRILTTGFRVEGFGGANNEGLDFNFQGDDFIQIAPTPGGAGIKMASSEFAFGTGADPDGTNNWVMIFTPGLRATALAGDYSEVLFTSSSAIAIAHAITTFATWTVNAPTISIVGGSIVDATNVLIQTNMSEGTNRYGLLVTSNPSGGTLNYAARFTGATGVRIDGLLEHNGTLLGFYGATPVVQSAAYTPTNVTPDRAYDADVTTVDELADVLGTLIADLQLTGIIG